MLEVEVVYVSETQVLFQKKLQLEAGACVQDALESSDLYAEFPECRGMTLAIYSQPAKPEQDLAQHDRIEVLRPLQIDPMDKRRMRAERRRS